MFKKVLLKILYWLFVILSLYYISVLLYSNFLAPKLKYKELKQVDHTLLSSLNNSPDLGYNRAEIKAKLEDTFNVHFYIYSEVESFKVRNGFIRRGQTILPIRLITISKQATKDNRMYAYVLAHELAHMKYMAVDERFIEFQVVKLLYESGDSNFKELAEWIARKQLKNDNNKEYDCAYYTYNYFLSMEG